MYHHIFNKAHQAVPQIPNTLSKFTHWTFNIFVGRLSLWNLVSVLKGILASVIVCLIIISFLSNLDQLAKTVLPLVHNQDQLPPSPSSSILTESAKRDEWVISAEKKNMLSDYSLRRRKQESLKTTSIRANNEF